MYIPAELLQKLPYVLVLGIKLLKNLPWKHTASYDCLFTEEKFLNNMHNWKPGFAIRKWRKQEDSLFFWKEKRLTTFSETALSNFCIYEFITKYT